MTRTEVNAFIKSGVDSLSPSVEYGRGRVSEFNSQVKTYPAVWFETSEMSTEIISTSNLPLDTWQINLHIAMLDVMGTTEGQYEDIVDRCDSIAQTLQFKYNQVVAGRKNLILSDLSRTPFIRKHANFLTGVLLSFKIVVPDQTDQTENCE